MAFASARMAVDTTWYLGPTGGRVGQSLNKSEVLTHLAFGFPYGTMNSCVGCGSSQSESTPIRLEAMTNADGVVIPRLEPVPFVVHEDKIGIGPLGQTVVVA